MSQRDAHDAERKSQLSNWVVAGIAVCFIAVQIFIEQFPHAGIAEWSFGALSGNAAGALALRSKSGRPWYWPALTLIVVAEETLIVAQGSDGLPTGLGKGLMLITLATIALTIGLLLWMQWLFDPHKKPRTEASRTVEVVIYGFVITFIALIGFVYWASVKSLGEDAKLARIVFSRQSGETSDRIMYCMNPEEHGHDPWYPVGDSTRSKRSYDYVQAVWTTVTDRGDSRTVEAATIRGRALTEREIARINRCL
jgi:cbb3-type cytochrome oxidase subunit 3